MFGANWNRLVISLGVVAAALIFISSLASAYTIYDGDGVDAPTDKCHDSNSWLSSDVTDYDGNGCRDTPWRPVVAVGTDHACFKLVNANIECVGDNSSGEGTAYTHNNASAVIAGENYSCILRTNLLAFCQGDNTHGAAAKYTGTQSIIDFDAGFNHTCYAAATGISQCHGSNDAGETNLHGRGSPHEIAAGLDHTCYKLDNFNVFCQGDNTHGQSGSYLNQNASRIAAGDDYTCVLRFDGTSHCYGNTSRAAAKAQTSPLASDISAMGNLTCYILVNGQHHCKGGDPTYNFNQITKLPVVALDVGPGVVCLATADGNAHCLSPDANKRWTYLKGDIERGDNDDDGDGISDSLDNCFRGSKNWKSNPTDDLDGDGCHNDNDPDRDGDGHTNGVDDFPDNAGEWLDGDNDGVGSNSDCNDKDATKTFDCTAPKVVNVGATGTTENGTYSIGDKIVIAVEFDEPVSVFEVPALRTTGVDAYYSGPGDTSKILLFEGTISTFAKDGRLKAASQYPIEIVDSWIIDEYGNEYWGEAPIGNKAGSLQTNTEIFVDITGPKIAKLGVVGTTANGTYIEGAKITIVAEFSEPIVWSGTDAPSFKLNSGGNAVCQTCIGGPTSNKAAFSYTVSKGEAAAPLDASGTLVLPDGTLMQDVHGNHGSISMPTGANTLAALANINVDAQAPYVVSVGNHSTTANGTYGVGKEIEIIVEFNEPVVADKYTRLYLNAEWNVLKTSPPEDTPSKLLTFTYTVDTGDAANPLQVRDKDSLRNVGAGIKDVAGNHANLILPAPGAAGGLSANRNIIVDTTAPAVHKIGGGETSPSGSYTSGDAIKIVVEFNEPVIVAGAPALKLSNGKSPVSGIAQINGPVPVGPVSELAFNLDINNSIYVISAHATEILYPGSSTISDVAGNPLGQGLPAYTNQNSLSKQRAINIRTDTDADGHPDPVDAFPLDATEYLDKDGDGVGSNADCADWDATRTVADDCMHPRVILAGIEGTTPPGTYHVGDVINFPMILNENVTIDGEPYFMLREGIVHGGHALAKCSNCNGTPTDRLNLTFTVEEGMDLTFAIWSNIWPHNATVVDKHGDDFWHAFYNGEDEDEPAEYYNLNKVKIDGRIPGITSITGPKAKFGDPYLPYKIGDNLQFVVGFDIPVTFTGGVPTLELANGKEAICGNCDSTTPSKVFKFNYKIQFGDRHETLQLNASKDLQVPAGTVVLGTTKANANLTIDASKPSVNLGPYGGYTIDTDVPRVVSVKAPGISDGAVLWHGFELEVKFSKMVTLDGAFPTVQLAHGVDAVCKCEFFPELYNPYVDSLRFTVPVQDGEFVPKVQLAAQQGDSFARFKDKAGNPVHLEFPVPGASGSITYSINFSLDLRDPKIVSIGGGSSSADGHYEHGDTLTIEVKFDEPVYGANQDFAELHLSSGGLLKCSSCQKNVYSDTLIFSGKIGVEELTDRLKVISPWVDKYGVPHDYMTKGTTGVKFTDKYHNEGLIKLPATNAANSIGVLRNISIGTDTDGDGTTDVIDQCEGWPDYDDADDDGTPDKCDFFPDQYSYQRDTDRDGYADKIDGDIDGDGQLNDDEIKCGSDPLDHLEFANDYDRDGKPNCIDPVPDDDGDGQANHHELLCGTDPKLKGSFGPDGDNDGIPDCADRDRDNDGVEAWEWAVDVVADGLHVCYLLSSGDVECYNKNLLDTYTMPGYDGGDAVAFDMTQQGVCVIRTNGNSVCTAGVTPPGTAMRPYEGGDAVKVQIGMFATCYLTSAGNVVCHDRYNVGFDFGRNDGQVVDFDMQDMLICYVLKNKQSECRGDKLPTEEQWKGGEYLYEPGFTNVKPGQNSIAKVANPKTWLKWGAKAAVYDIKNIVEHGVFPAPLTGDNRYRDGDFGATTLGEDTPWKNNYQGAERVVMSEGQTCYVLEDGPVVTHCRGLNDYTNPGVHNYIPVSEVQTVEQIIASKASQEFLDFDLAEKSPEFTLRSPSWPAVIDLEVSRKANCYLFADGTNLCASYPGPDLTHPHSGERAVKVSAGSDLICFVLEFGSSACYRDGARIPSIEFTPRGDQVENDPTELVDSDWDGVGDGKDAFPTDPWEWADFDGDLIGDNVDTDWDNDGAPNSWEAVYGTDPYNATDLPLDTDGDLIPDLYDLDDDNDGVNDRVAPIDVVAGHGFTCYLLENGNSWCAGEKPGVTDPYLNGDAIAISAFGDNLCYVIASGDGFCLNGNQHSALPGYTGKDAIAVAAGQSHVCYLLKSASTQCFGGGPSSARQSQANVIAVDAGNDYTCVVTKDGYGSCAGLQGSYVNTLEVSTFYNGGDAIDVSVSQDVVCYRTTSGGHCVGPLGAEQSISIAGPITEVAAGPGYGCFVQINGNAVCTATKKEGPTQHYQGGDATKLAIGDSHVCYILLGGESHCNGIGAPGNGPNAAYVGEPLDFAPLDASEWIDSDGDGFGDNTEYAAGSNPFNAHSTPPDWDNDGIFDAKDNDIDGDSLANGKDGCVYSTPGWIAWQSDDHDYDGCRDSSEDHDDDNDGVPDKKDVCPLGPPNWPATKAGDFDGDGCLDDVGDDDDDNDGRLDKFDFAPKNPYIQDDPEAECEGGSDNCSDTKKSSCNWEPGYDDSCTDNDGDLKYKQLGDCNDNHPLVWDDCTDTDGDGQLDVDEKACGSSPESAGMISPDYDEDFIPDCRDPDGDNDGIPNEKDSAPLNEGVWNHAPNEVDRDLLIQAGGTRTITFHGLDADGDYLTLAVHDFGSDSMNVQTANGVNPTMTVELLEDQDGEIRFSISDGEATSSGIVYVIVSEKVKPVSLAAHGAASLGELEIKVFGNENQIEGSVTSTDNPKDVSEPVEDDILSEYFDFDIALPEGTKASFTVSYSEDDPDEEMTVFYWNGGGWINLDVPSDELPYFIEGKSEPFDNTVHEFTKDPGANTITVKLDHFSVYGVGKSSAVTTTSPASSGGGGGGGGWGVAPVAQPIVEPVIGPVVEPEPAVEPVVEPEPVAESAPGPAASEWTAPVAGAPDAKSEGGSKAPLVIVGVLAVVGVVWWIRRK